MKIIIIKWLIWSMKEERLSNRLIMQSRTKRLSERSNHPLHIWNAGIRQKLSFEWNLSIIISSTWCSQEQRTMHKRRMALKPKQQKHNRYIGIWFSLKDRGIKSVLKADKSILRGSIWCYFNQYVYERDWQILRRTHWYFRGHF